MKDAADDAFDEETEQIIRNYHKERDEQLKRLQHARFGRVYPISREDYTREVTEASKVDAEDADAKGKGTGVVCFLYKDGCAHHPGSLHYISTDLATNLASHAVTVPLSRYVCSQSVIRTRNLSQ